MKEESRTSSDRNASHSKRSGLLDFGNSYDVLDDFSQGTRELWSISDHECQQGGRTDPDMEEESRTSSDHNASHLKRSGPLDFGNSYDVLDVFSQGTRGLWSIGDSTTLAYHPISSRVAMSKEGISTYIMCSCVSKLRQGANASFGVFKSKQDQSWHLAVVQSFFYLNQDGTDTIHLLEWTGSISSNGNPDFYSSTCWETFRPHFTPRVFNAGDIEFFFVNKVRGNTFPTYTIPDETRSNIDGGIQCNPKGPDEAPPGINIPVDRKTEVNTNLSTLLISSTIDPFFEKMNDEIKSSTAERRRQKRFKSSPQSDLLKYWMKLPPRKRRDDASLCVIVVSKSNGEYLTPADTRSLGDIGGLFIFPSLPTGDGSESNVQKFYGILPRDYPHVMESINGISPSQANSVLIKYSMSCHVLFNATSLSHPDRYQYTKVFLSSEVAPTIHSGNTRINLPDMNRQVTYTFESTTSYSEHIPLSAAIVDPTLHDVTYNQQ